MILDTNHTNSINNRSSKFGWPTYRQETHAFVESGADNGVSVSQDAIDVGNSTLISVGQCMQAPPQEMAMGSSGKVLV